MKKTLLSLFFVFLLYKTYSSTIISVISPAYCAEIQGSITINISASGFDSVTVYCWQQGGEFGVNSTIGTVMLDTMGLGSIVFPADEYPHGPITVRISGKSGVIPDNCYLQLYNKGGVSWKEGIPADPPPADGMVLKFSDDFTGMSIGGDGSGAVYYDHKPPRGNEDFSSIPFTSFSSSKNPFSQKDSYLRIRADANKNSTGLISSMFSDKSGFKIQAPCYFECRFVAPNATGTWPAFWLLSVKDNINSYSEICDELDIIEAYGGEGSGSPNAGPLYSIAAHAWGQTGDPLQICNEFYSKYFPTNMYNHGIPSTWYEPHIYGCKINKDTTYYYCDNIEVGKHKTLPVSRVKPFYFMINLATGGGWPVNLSRYNGLADMYVDYVRVYKDTTTVHVTGVDIDQVTASMNVGETQQLTASVLPVIATNETVNWSSDNTSVATVDSNGKVTGISEGSASITATTQDGGYTVTSVITVLSPVTGLSTGKKNNKNVFIYPNPVTSETAIWLDSPALTDILVNIYNVSGQTVLSCHTYQQGKIKIPIDLSDLSNGMYLVKINVWDSQFNRTIIK